MLQHLDHSRKKAVESWRAIRLSALYSASFAVAFSVACSIRGTIVPASNSSYNGKSNSTVLATNNQRNSDKGAAPSRTVRSIDFKNFTYPWYPSFLKPPTGVRELRLQDGKFEVDEDKLAQIANFIVELEDVSYVDLLGTGEEQAIVTLSGIETFNSFVGNVFIFGVQKNKPVVLWQHEIGDRADGGLRRIAVEDRVLVVEQYQRTVGDGGLCCPKIFVRSYYKWNGDQFQKTKSATMPNDYGNARFLGYPADKP
jgi:hypothetical protein